MDTQFVKLNHDWNAEPVDPQEDVCVRLGEVVFSFNLNPWAYEADEGERASLHFSGAIKWRLGPKNDEGWYRGQCRYSGVAPAWGEFYELIGTDHRRDQPEDWHEKSAPLLTSRHFLFHLKENTFECVAANWSLRR